MLFKIFNSFQINYKYFPDNSPNKYKNKGGKIMRKNTKIIMTICMLVVFSSVVSVAGTNNSAMISEKTAGLSEEIETYNSGEKEESYVIEIFIPPCPWDVNGDGEVTPQDVGLVKYYYGQDPSIPEYAPYDVNDDGAINPQDVGLVKYYYGPCPTC